MKSMTRTHLERLATAAHRRGDTWAAFYPTVAADVAALEPWDRQAYRRLVRRLSRLLTCGDLDGQPIANSWPRPEEWELPDHPPAKGFLHPPVQAVPLLRQ